MEPGDDGGTVVPGREGARHVALAAAAGRVGLGLADQSKSAEITVPPSCSRRPRRRPGAARWARCARHLDRAVGIAGIDDVGGIGAGAKGCWRGTKSKGRPALKRYPMRSASFATFHVSAKNCRPEASVIRCQ